MQAFQSAIDEINENSYTCLRGSKLNGTIIRLYPGDSFKAAKEGETLPGGQLQGGQGR